MASGRWRLSSRYWRRMGERPTSSSPGRARVRASGGLLLLLIDIGRALLVVGRVGDLLEAHVGSPEDEGTQKYHRQEQRRVHDQRVGGRWRGCHAGRIAEDLDERAVKRPDVSR